MSMVFFLFSLFFGLILQYIGIHEKNRYVVFIEEVLLQTNSIWFHSHFSKTGTRGFDITSVDYLQCVYGLSAMVNGND